MKRYLPMFILSLLSNCIDPIQFTTEKRDGFLVVDGLITNEHGPYYVTLSYTQPFYSENSVKVTGAVVEVFDNSGRKLAFGEIAPGRYKSDSVQFGQIGKKYHVKVEVNGTMYESEPEEMHPVPEIDDLYFEFERRTKINDKDVEIPDDRFNIYVDAHFDNGESPFLRWKWNGTYQTITHPEDHLDETGSPAPLECSCCIYTGVLVVVRECTCCNCWVAEASTDAVITNAKDYNEAGLNKHQIAIVGIDHWRFLVKYYLEVQQYSLSQKAYDFWRLVDLQEKNRGTVFDTPPADIQSNIYNVNDPSEKIYGYFGASAVVRKSIFINRSDVPYLLKVPEPINGDCRQFRGGKNTEPSFWQ